MSIETIADQIRQNNENLTLDVERWINLLEQLTELDEYVPQLLKDADREYWIVLALSKFLSLAIENKQHLPLEKTLSGHGHFVETRKLIRSVRLVPKTFLELYNFDYVILGGIYINMPVVVADCGLCPLSDNVDDREFVINHKLPENYHYGTRKLIEERFLLSLQRNKICPFYLKSAQDWEYFELF